MKAKEGYCLQLISTELSKHKTWQIMHITCITNVPQLLTSRPFQLNCGKKSFFGAILYIGQHEQMT